MLNAARARAYRHRLAAQLAAWKLAHPLRYQRAIQATVLVVAMIAGSAAWYIGSALYHLPSKEAVGRIGDMNQATAVFDRENQIAFTIFKEQRIDVPLDRVSPMLVKAVISTEDQRFY